MPSSAGLDLARHLLEREVGGAEEPVAVGTAMHRALMSVSENLRRSVGDDGYNALVSRAITRTQTAHPALIEMRRGDAADISLDGVAASVDAHGVTTVAAAVESLLASLADVLGGLIGADMVPNLLDPDAPLRETPKRRETL